MWRKCNWQVLEIHIQEEGKTDFFVTEKQDVCAEGGMISHMETHDPVLTHSVNNHRVMLDLESSLWPHVEGSTALPTCPFIW